VRCAGGAGLRDAGGERDVLRAVWSDLLERIILRQRIEVPDHAIGLTGVGVTVRSNSNSGMSLARGIE